MSIGNKVTLQSVSNGLVMFLKIVNLEIGVINTTYGRPSSDWSS